jgi:SAM-dependent methyltransferase
MANRGGEYDIVQERAETLGEGRWSMGRLLQTSGSYLQACTLHAALRLDVFTVLGEGSRRAAAVAETIGADPRATETLLNALTAMGLIIKRGETFSNTPESRTFLVKGAPEYVGFLILHHHHLVPAWSRLSDAVQGGKPVRKKRRSKREIESFLMGMFNQAMAIAPNLALTIDLSERRHLLDLGGGPGTYAVHFCLANPGLEATVMDLSSTRPYALKTIERFGLGGRIRFKAGNGLKDDLGGPYDAAWLSHLLHSLGPEECREVIKKVVSALTPGGILFIHDFILDNTLASPLFPALFSLNMLVNTEAGRAYPEKDIRDMLSEAGLKSIERLPFKGPTESGILKAAV